MKLTGDLRPSGKSTADKTEYATSEFPRGTVSACTPADRAALTDLYRAVYRHATPFDLTASIRDEETAAWSAYRDEHGRILVAALIYQDGTVWVPMTC